MQKVNVEHRLSIVCIPMAKREDHIEYWLSIVHAKVDIGR